MKKKTPDETIPGALVKIPMSRNRDALDGFWHPGVRQSDALLVFVHGMGGNFYGSAFKRECLRQAPSYGVDALTFNNRGAGAATQTERFADSLADLDAVMNWSRRRGYRRVFLLGHSTGCQKATLYAARRRTPAVAGLILAAPADDLAIARRETGRRYSAALRRAATRVAAGKGDAPDPCCRGFSARRFLSLARPGATEAELFNYDGPLRVFSGLRLPVLALFGTREEYACRPVTEMGKILGSHSRSEDFEFFVIPQADHSFRRHETTTVARIFDWIRRHSPVPRPMGRHGFRV
jgi:pimeloyl-ACP methyl ester carboxylesterase